MAKVTLVIAVLLIALGLIGFLGTGSQYRTALIPTWFGLALGVFGFLAMSPSESRRKLFMHINVTIGLLGFLGAGGRAVVGYGHLLRRAAWERSSGWERCGVAGWVCAQSGLRVDGAHAQARLTSPNAKSTLRNFGLKFVPWWRRVWACCLSAWG
jgi:hypothetical protein